MGSEGSIWRWRHGRRAPFENGLVYWRSPKVTWACGSGSLAANAKLRADVVPGGREQGRSKPGTRPRIPWADLMYRAERSQVTWAYGRGIEVRRCDCGGKFELIAEITTPT